MSKNLESQHDTVFGKTLALYNKTEMEEFVGFFERRFEANGINPTELFNNKICLDAGCGNGRGSIFMMSNKAKRVDFADISPTNIDSTQKNLETFGFSNCNGHETSLETLPFEDESFDFVWCNGVVMHTHDPDSCLKELARVLRVGGKAWIYVYGSGGTYWYIVRRFRSLLSYIPADACINTLRLMGYANRYVAEYLDDWKVPYLRTYTDADFSKRLEDLGFNKPQPLPYGVPYDTSHRRTIFPKDIIWLGDGDLRYLTTKRTAVVDGTGRPISDSEYGSNSPFSAEIVNKFKAPFDQLEQIVIEEPVLALATCAKIQFALRKILNQDGPFAVGKVEQVVYETLRLAKESQETLGRCGS